MKKVKYKTFDNGKYIGTFTSTQIENQFGVIRTGVSNYAHEGRLAKNRYLFEAVEESKEINTALINEWDRVRMCILQGVRP